MFSFKGKIAEEVWSQGGGALPTPCSPSICSLAFVTPSCLAEEGFEEDLNKSLKKASFCLLACVFE